MTPAPQVSVSFSSLVEALEQKEIERRAREARMSNALEILAVARWVPHEKPTVLASRVRRTACEGLGRET